MTRAVGVLAFLIGVAGVLDSSQATTGVALVGFACLLGIFARLEQASQHQRQLLDAARPSDPQRPDRKP